MELLYIFYKCRHFISASHRGVCTCWLERPNGGIMREQWCHMKKLECCLTTLTAFEQWNLKSLYLTFSNLMKQTMHQASPFYAVSLKVSFRLSFFTYALQSLVVHKTEEGIENAFNIPIGTINFFKTTKILKRQRVLGERSGMECS